MMKYNLYLTKVVTFIVSYNNQSNAKCGHFNKRPKCGRCIHVYQYQAQRKNNCPAVSASSFVQEILHFVLITT